ncbi:MAG: hypothetical protein QNJ09_15510 [Paracoccaceae bacterium]|nr:hypothetical protein [Paracoccaceae bacterium]
MELFVLLSFLTLALAAASTDGDDTDTADTGGETPPNPWQPDDDTQGPGDEEPGPGDPASPVSLSITSSGAFTGSTGDDTITLGDPADLDLDGPVSILANDGDDLIDLFPGDDYSDAEALDDALIAGLNVDAGAGDDTVDAVGETAVIDAGTGDDSISFFGIDTTITSGEGDDVVTVESGGGDPIIVDGGPGADTITGAVNVRLNGGEGDDVVTGIGGPFAGAGYVAVSDGGPGDDTVGYDVLTDLSGQGSTQIARGGTGADQFVLTIDEGDPDATIDFASTPALGQLDGEGNTIFGAGDYRFSDTSEVFFDTLVVEDFEPGIDSLVLEADAQGDGYALASVTISEVSAPGGGTDTEVALRYENPASFDRVVIVTLEGATGVSASDISLDGADPDLSLEFA